MKENSPKVKVESRGRSNNNEFREATIEHYRIRSEEREVTCRYSFEFGKINLMTNRYDYSLVLDLKHF